VPQRSGSHRIALQRSQLHQKDTVESAATSTFTPVDGTFPEECTRFPPYTSLQDLRGRRPHQTVGLYEIIASAYCPPRGIPTLLPVKPGLNLVPQIAQMFQHPPCRGDARCITDLPADAPVHHRVAVTRTGASVCHKAVGGSTFSSLSLTHRPPGHLVKTENRF
jgi:hypothetical protein